MFSLFAKNTRSSTESVDIIETAVYAYLKPLGFRKHGRTLHRFVDHDISQVVHFQNGCPSKGVYDLLWVNLGIRIPECAERKFIIEELLKKYYHEYECNIRTRLGLVVDGKDTCYDLRKDPHKIGKEIIEHLKRYVLPVFEILSNRDAILEHRIEYAAFDEFNQDLILLEEAMMFGRKGDLHEATRLFRAYYQKELAEYHHDLEEGSKIYLKKGERMVYRNAKTNETETIVATKNGYVTTYCANRGHLTYLETLAQELEIVLDNP